VTVPPVTDEAPPRLVSAAPVFQVGDVATSMHWYEQNLGFEAFPFPSKPPHAFCILVRDAVEIMLQRVDGQQKLDVYKQRPAGVWHAYLRIEEVHTLYKRVRARPEVVVLEPLKRQPYGDTEFVIADPDGHVLVFSELVSDSQ
jgi:uncharacterized glyoxalase superfamily protein PhnB